MTVEKGGGGSLLEVREGEEEVPRNLGGRGQILKGSLPMGKSSFKLEEDCVKEKENCVTEEED